jgi:predicted dienelactone hydrolase
VARLAHIISRDTIPSSFVDQLLRLNWGANLRLWTCCVLALALCCLTSPASAAGIQLLESNPGLSGAIWYPCAREPKQVALGVLAVNAEFELTGVQDCPVTGTRLPLIVFSHGRGAWFGAHHDTAEALADAGFIVAAINHPGDNANDPPYPSGRRVRPISFVCSTSC